MKQIISKIILHNFKRFQDTTFSPNKNINIIVGDNESGKSSLLQAIDFVISGSIKKVEDYGIDRIINVNAINKFKSKINNSQPCIRDLPYVEVDLFLTPEGNNYELNGRNNLEGEETDGLRMECAINEEYENEINNIWKTNPEYFPYDYYVIKFSTFSGNSFTYRARYLKSILVDSCNINSKYATEDFIRRVYEKYTTPEDRVKNQASYRLMKENFSNNELNSLNNLIPQHQNYQIALKNASDKGISQDLMIYEDHIPIDNKGAGRQVFIKTEFAINKGADPVNIILIEEPENHLSHINLIKLVDTINTDSNCQLFVTTHSSLICSRLDLLNVSILSRDVDNILSLNTLKVEDSSFFKKCPPINILEFCLSKKVILVEGPSEYILFEKFYKKLSNGKKLEDDGIQVLDARGLSFKRYLSVAKITKSKVAVITDNDTDYKNNVLEKYKDFIQNNIKIFSDKDNNNRTFEIVLAKCNMKLCCNLFEKDNLESCITYMLHNKADCALKLLESEEDLEVPSYIREAINWIKE